MRKIREICLREDRTEKDISILVAKISDEGDLVMEGYDCGETPKAFWGDSDYEYDRIIRKEHKGKVLKALIEEKFSDQADYRRWLDEKGIPNKSRYEDTILLWLIKDRFRSESDFADWIHSRNIPNEFFSWV